MKGIIFDVDGTLWDSTREVAVAWNKVLQDEMEGHEILTAEGLQKEFGKPMDAIAESLFPELSEKDRMELLGKMMAYENELVAVGPCVIYNGVPETIKALSKKYPLYIVSNCQDGYIEAFLKNSGLGGYFKDFTCPAYTGRLKGENIRIIMEGNGLDVGDTQGDANACKEAEVPMIFASYGFGEVEGEYLSIRAFTELQNIDFDRL